MADQSIQKLIDAIKAKDVNVFRASLTEDFAYDMTPKVIAALIEPISPRLAAGYSLERIGTLKHQDVNVDLYKLIVADGGDDILIRSILEDDKIAGLLITAPFE